jgi:hypothetical protein
MKPTAVQTWQETYGKDQDQKAQHTLLSDGSIWRYDYDALTGTYAWYEVFPPVPPCKEAV